MAVHNQILDDFKTKLAAISDERKQVEEIHEFTTNYGDSYSEEILPLLEKAVEISKRISFEPGEIICKFNLMFYYGLNQGNALQSKYFFTAPQLLDMLEKIKYDQSWYSFGLNLLAYYYWFRGEYEKGFAVAFDAIKHIDQRGDKNSGWFYFSLGIFYFDTKDFENSRLYYQKAYDSFCQFDNLYGKARAGNGLGSVAIQMQELDKALLELKKASSIYRELKHHAGLSRALNDMALLEKVKKNYPKSIDLFNESIKLREEIKHVQGLITSLTELGEVYLFQGELKKALEYLNPALEYSTNANAKQKSMRLYKLLYEIHKNLNDIPLALKHFEEYYELKTGLMGDEANNNIKRLQTNFEKEKSEKEAEIERLKNVELKIAYELIEQKNKDIHDSIIYASRIQRSLLPTEKYIERALNESKQKK